MANKSLIAILVTAAFVVSTALKIWFVVADHWSETTDIRPRLIEVLHEAGFSAREVRNGWATVGARLGPCYVLAAKITPNGWDRDIIFNTAAPGSRVVFFFRGRAYADQPKWRTWRAEKLYQVEHAFRRDLKHDWLIAFTFGGSCAVDVGRWAATLDRI